ncbi:MAG: NAD(P)-dependent oxidoreductase, partial [Pseudomonadota bacterium]|nr:NAD(P)-dependent oxidoreductase [Pseudomonadota bacterium]
VGVAGLGRMGAAIAERLKEVGHELTVWNRSPEKTKSLAEAGAGVASSPAELAECVDAVITILTDADAIRAVYQGPSGLLSADVRGKLFIEMSTVQPATEIELAEAVRAKGAAFVECPVGGTTGPARTGKLIGLAGGEADDVARARPILDQLCRRLEHVGPVGAGASMKLAINLPLLVFWQAFGEAYSLCRHLGADTGKLVELFSDTSGGPNVLKVRSQAVAAALDGGDPGPATFDVDSIRKDLRTMIAEAKQRGTELPLVERTLAVYDEASQAGWGGRDSASLAAYWPSRTSR